MSKILFGKIKKLCKLHKLYENNIKETKLFILDASVLADNCSHLESKGSGNSEYLRHFMMFYSETIQ
ncbi:hypothetical protein WN48_03578 [Eufriesea mexicana]|nr:hypothetical protein WN48_03578 [Eufriesea mexicana]